MNMEEYRKRIEKTHTFTGVPSYWEDLQIAIAERDRFQQLAEELYERGMLQVKTTELYKSQAHVQRALHEKSVELVDELNEEIERWKRRVIHLVEIEDCNQTNCEMCEDTFSAYEQTVHSE